MIVLLHCYPPAIQCRNEGIHHVAMTTTIKIQRTRERNHCFTKMSTRRVKQMKCLDDYLVVVTLAKKSLPTIYKTPVQYHFFKNNLSLINFNIRLKTGIQNDKMIIKTVMKTSRFRYIDIGNKCQNVIAEVSTFITYYNIETVL